MTSSPVANQLGPLPDFAHPPVVEVALAVAFQPLQAFRVVDFGVLWQRYCDEFPRVAEQPPLEMLIEQPGARGSAPALSFSLLTTPPLPRLWFQNEDESHLVQVQNNWFSRNWRKVSSSNEYPRYPQIRERFVADLSKFLDYLRENARGDFKPTQCEITFINHLSSAGGDPQPLVDVLTILRQDRAGVFLPAPESIRVNSQYEIALAGEPVGRLHITAEPAILRSTGDSITVLNLTARGRPLGQGLDGVVDFLDLGHDWVVRGFDDATTDGMHQKWGKTSG